MSESGSAAIALGSLLLAALTVVVSFLNVRRQAEATLEVERSKWMLLKRDEVYRRLVAQLVKLDWHAAPKSGDQEFAEIDATMSEAVMYATDDVLREAQALWREVQKREPTARGRVGPRRAAEGTARSNLVRAIRTELVGAEEATRTWDRYAVEAALRARTVKRAKPRRPTTPRTDDPPDA